MQAFRVSSTELREITDALVILSIAVIAYLATSWIVIDHVFEMSAARPTIFVGIAMAIFGIRRVQDQGASGNAA